MELLKNLILEPRFHVALAFMWVLLVPPTLIFWAESIIWVLMISIYANIVGHWGAYQAARAEQSEKAGLDNEDLHRYLEHLDKKLDHLLDLLEKQTT